MGCLITGFVFGVVGCLILVVTKFLIAEETAFHENKHPRKAEVTGHRHRREGHKGYNLYVKLLDINDDKEYICKGKNILPAKYPIGTIVDVFHARYRNLGIYVDDIRLVSDMPADGFRIAKIISTFAKMMLAVATLLVTMGIIVLL